MAPIRQQANGSLLTWTGGSTRSASSQVTYVSATQLTISIKLGASADNWTAKATNPDGQSSGAVGFRVITPAPAPSITSVTPNPITADPANGYQTLTINGANFVNKPTSRSTWTGQAKYHGFVFAGDLREQHPVDDVDQARGHGRQLDGEGHKP